MSFVDKAGVFEAIRPHLRAEFGELFGTYKSGSGYRCPFHGDSNPSLSVSFKTSAWRCHACGEAGDIFAAYSKLRGSPFKDALEYYRSKYGIRPSATTIREVAAAFPKPLYPRPSTTDALTGNGDAMAVLAHRYGINEDSVRRFQLGWAKNRLEIPILNASGELVNVRSHDIMRLHCAWRDADKQEVVYSPSEEDHLTGKYKYKPDWSGSGKVRSVKDHGKPVVYPVSVLEDNQHVYLVGGELKAIMMLQIGYAAVCITNGEGAIPPEVSKLFAGKTVDIIFDADPEKERDEFGDSMIDRRAHAVGENLVLHGAASARRARWPQRLLEVMPRGGDVNDLWNLVQEPFMALFDKWVHIGAANTANDEVVENDVSDIRFGELCSTEYLLKDVRVRAQVVGHVDIPIVAVTSATVNCDYARTGHSIKLCEVCPLMSCGFTTSRVLSPSEVVETLGAKPTVMEKWVKEAVGVPAKCRYPVISYENSTADDLIIASPSDDHTEGADASNRRLVYITPDGKPLTDGETYSIDGIVMADSTAGNRYLLYSKSANRVSTAEMVFTEDKELDELALRVFAGDIDDTLMRLAGDLADNLTGVYASPELHIASMLSFFMPFKYRIGGVMSERISPVTAILGDTTTGKSTVASQLARFYSVGRTIQCDTYPSLPGLLGGMESVGQHNKYYRLGTVPMAHLRHLFWDEFGSLNEEIVRAMMSTWSSGIASRAIVGGRQSMAWVRHLLTFNPRGNRSLRTYKDPYEAAAGVMLMPQALGRIDLLHVQYQVKDRAAYMARASKVEHRYKTQLAVHTIRFAWTRTADQIIFEDDDHLRSVAYDTAMRMGNRDLLLPASARWKYGRVAAAIAGLLYSRDGDNLIVKKEHVLAADVLYRTLYDRWMEKSPASSKYVELYELMMRYPYNQLERLNVFTSGKVRFSFSDLEHIFRMKTSDVIDIMMASDILTKNGTMYLVVDQEELAQFVDGLVNERRRSGT